jgi:predicted transcriptional regulator
MKYSEKVRMMEALNKRIIEGASIEQAASLIEEFQISQYEFERVLDLTISEVYSTYRSEIKTNIFENKPLNELDELSKLHNDFVIELHKKAIPDLVQVEQQKVDEMLKDKYPEEEILENIRLDIYPEESVIKQIKKWHTDRVKKTRNTNLLLISGPVFIGIFLWSLLPNSLTRPMFFQGLIGVILLWRGINDFNKLKKE